MPFTLFAIQLFFIRREQRRLAELEPLIATSLNLDPNHPAYPGFRASLALLHAELAQHERAREGLEIFPAALPVGLTRVYCLCVLAETCALIRAPELGASFYEQLSAYAGRNAVATAASVCLGSVSRQLGLLAELDERLDEAEGHLEVALHANRRMGAHLWLAHVECDLARVRTNRGAPGDRKRADEAIIRCLHAADEWGLDALRERARAVQGQLA